jgi:SulP family sulfate permease
MLYEVNGPLFFGAADSAMDALKAVGARMRVLILGLEAVPAIDVTGLVALESALSRLKQQGVLTLVAGARPQPLSVLQKAGIREDPGGLRFCESLEEAVRVAAEYVSAG